MATSHLIKICGIRDPEMAAQAAIAGVDLIGIIFHPSSPRYVSLDQAAVISHAATKAGVVPVAVFVNNTNVEMCRICEATKIKTVQLHGTAARAHHHLLPDEYQRIYVQAVSNKGELQTDKGLLYLDPDRDLVLIDHVDPGQGNKINWLAFHYDLPFPWLLAGGLTPSNVVAAINDLQPDGVDVSSGVESSKGNKDIFLIQRFITSVRGHKHVA
jgi:phosphoribosylanthranilate isomerase